MKKNLLNLSICFCLMTLSAVAQNWEWARNPNSAGHGYGGYVCFDNNNAIYTCGQLDPGMVTIGTYSVNVTTQPAHYVGKFDLAGNPLWAKAYNLKTYVNAIGSDRDGNLYAVGTFNNPLTSINIDGVVLTYDGNTHSRTFFAKYAPDGKLIWARNDIYALSLEFSSIALDNNGNLIITGAYWAGPLKVGGLSYPWASIPGWPDTFVAKFDSSGNSVWTKTLLGTSNDNIWAVSTNVWGEVYVTGSFNSPSLNIGGVNFSKKDTTTNSYDFFVAKYDAAGNYLWAHTAGGTLDIVGVQKNGLVVDEAGRVTITGGFSDDSISFDSKTVYGNYVCQNAFVVQYDNNGTVLWANSAFGGGNTVGYSITKDYNNNIYVLGQFATQANFGSQSFYSAGNTDIFVFECDPNGNIKWATTAGGLGADIPQRICWDQADGLYVSGYTTSEGLMFGSNIVDSTGIFLAKLSSLTGVAEYANDRMNIYPNPSNGQFTVSCSQFTVNATIDVYNALGEKVYSDAFNSKQKTVNCKLETGIYFVRVSDEKNNLIQKIIIE